MLEERERVNLQVKLNFLSEQIANGENEMFFPIGEFDGQQLRRLRAMMARERRSTSEGIPDDVYYAGRTERWSK